MARSRDDVVFAILFMTGSEEAQAASEPQAQAPPRHHSQAAGELGSGTAPGACLSIVRSSLLCAERWAFGVGPACKRAALVLKHTKRQNTVAASWARIPDEERLQSRWRVALSCSSRKVQPYSTVATPGSAALIRSSGPAQLITRRPVFPILAFAQDKFLQFDVDMSGEQAPDALLKIWQEGNGLGCCVSAHAAVWSLCALRSHESRPSFDCHLSQARSTGTSWLCSSGAPG